MGGIKLSLIKITVIVLTLLLILAVAGGLYALFLLKRSLKQLRMLALARRRAEEELKRLSHYDTSTKLPNRVLFQDHLNFELSHAKTPPKLIAVMIFSLSDLREIVLAYGAESAEKLVISAADRIRNSINPGSQVGRISESEFAVLDISLSIPAQVVGLVSRIFENLKNPYHIDNTEILSNVCCGISLYPNDGKDFETLMQCATLAVQNSTKNRSMYEFYQEGMNRKVQAQRNLVVDLHYAIENKQFTLYFQPQMNLETNKCIGCETLIRWFHPIRGTVPPFVFITAAEEAGIVNAIDEWVLFDACRQGNAWLQAGLKSIKIAVNISGNHFADSALVHKIKACLEKTGFPPENLEIEITESALMMDVQKGLYVMKEICALGVHLALDDFGTGYSSLGYLKNFPVKKIKIDKSFIDNIGKEESADAIVKGIIELGHSLGLKVLAEGGETEMQINILKGYGCDVVQGYYFSKPLPVGEFEQFLKNNS